MIQIMIGLIGLILGLVIGVYICQLTMQRTVNRMLKEQYEEENDETIYESSHCMQCKHYNDMEYCPNCNGDDWEAKDEDT